MSTARPADLSVLVSCHGFALAIPIKRVVRLLTYDDLAESPELPRRAPNEPRGVVKASGQLYAHWDLETLMDLPPLRASWMLLRIPHAGTEVPVALSTGPCRIVHALGALTPLPPGAFQARRSAIWAAFAAPPTPDGRTSPVGLCIDLLRLWSSAELERSAAQVFTARAAVPVR